METISKYIDLRLSLIILVALISFIVLKFLYKKISLPKILQTLLTIIVIVGNLYFIYTYIDTIESEYIDTESTYYINGKVKFISNAINKIKIEYSNTNMVVKDLDSKEILIKITNSTSIYDKKGNKITLSDINKGDNISITTVTHTITADSREITAKKIQKY